MFTVILVTYKPNKIKLKKILNKIDKRVNIIIIDNSEDLGLANFKFSKKTKIIKSKNHGNGAGINIGLNNCKTKFAIYLDIDVNFKKNFINDFFKKTKRIKNFTLLIPNHGNIKSNKLVEKYEGEAAMILFNIPKLKKIGFFDEKYFLYFEETDLLYRCKKNDLKVFFIGSLKIKHFRASSVVSNRKKITNLRSWHYMWSMFYFYRKNFNYFKALKKTYIFLFKDLLMFLFYLLTINFNKSINRFYRLFGAISSMLFLKAFLRP